MTDTGSRKATPPLGALVDGLLRGAVDALVVVDTEQRIVAMSQIACEWLDCDIGMLQGQPMKAVLRFAEPSARSSMDHSAAVVEPMRWALERGWINERFDHFIALFSGRAVPVRASFAALFDADGGVCGAVCAMSDFSEAADAAQALTFARDHDPITGLPNREHFERLLERSERSTVPPNRPFWVAFADVDRFRLVNDAAGHSAGDAMLNRIAGAFRSALRAGDALARIGGDEFGILLQPCSRREVEALLERVVGAARGLQFSWQGRDFPSTVTMGVAPLSSTTRDAHSAMRLAERARYAGKESGRGNVCFATDQALSGEHDVEVAAVSRILSALEAGRFVLHAQDVVRLDRPAVPVYREMLVRMRDERGGLLPPSQFIPGAERYFMMDALDRWVIEATLAMLSAGDDDGVLHAINLSGQSVSDPRFRCWLVDTLRGRPDLCGRLCFEVTETAAVRQMSVARELFDELADMGASLALDDFGAGMSSFGYLTSLPVRYLKIDGHFVRGLDDPFYQQVVRAICDVGRAAELQCIAEHVEDTSVIPRLAELGVHMAQGWGIARETAFVPYRADDGRLIEGNCA